MVTRERVQSVLDRIRPLIQSDGGDIELVDIVDNKAKVRLTGNCVGCPSAQMTLPRRRDNPERRDPELEEVLVVYPRSWLATRPVLAVVVDCSDAGADSDVMLDPDTTRSTIPLLCGPALAFRNRSPPTCSRRGRQFVVSRSPDHWACTTRKRGRHPASNRFCRIEPLLGQ